MAKTINKNMDIFNSEAAALRAFNKTEVPCDMLYSESVKSWFVDRAKQAVKEWPKHYNVINTK